jgi:hypothetical protein
MNTDQNITTPSTKQTANFATNKQTVMYNYYSELPQIIQQIGSMRFVGNIIPNEWFNQIKLESGRTDTQAIIILSEIIYWYRPSEIRNDTNIKQRYKKKFKLDMLQLSIKTFMDKFSFTRGQVKKALNNLANNGFIKKELRTIKINGISHNNVLYIEPIYEGIYGITYPQGDKNITESPKIQYQPKHKLPTTSDIQQHNSADPQHYSTDPQHYSADPQHYSADKYKDYNKDYDKEKKDDDKKIREKETENSSLKAKTKPTLKTSSSVDFVDLKWPEGLPKTAAILKILKKLKDNNARQQVLNVYAQESSKNDIRSKAGFLQALSNNYLNNDFTEATSIIKTPEDTRELQVEKLNTQLKINQCPYCDEQGNVYFKRKNGSSICNPKCPHTKPNFNVLQLENVMEITSAKKGYRSVPQVQNKLTVLPVNNHKPKKAHCNYCNNENILIMRDSKGGDWKFNCNHDDRYIRSMKKSDAGFPYTEIITAKNGYKILTDINNKAVNEIQISLSTNKDCPYCDENSMVKILSQFNQTTTMLCRHPVPLSKKAWIWEVVKHILSAKKGYQTQDDHQINNLN